MDEATETGHERDAFYAFKPTLQQFMPEGKSETELVVEGGMTTKGSLKEMPD